MIGSGSILLVVSAYSQIAGPDIMLRLLSVLVLIAINAFFVIAEFSFVSVRRSRINQLVEAGDLQAKTVQNLQRSLDRLLSTTQLGITLSSLALGWIGERTLAVLVTRWLVLLPLPLDINLATHSLSIPISFFLIAYLQIVLGELCPKALALLYSEQLSRFLGPAVRAIARFFNPFIWILNQSTRLLLRVFGIRYTGQMYNRLSPEELQMIIATEHESTGLEAEERQLLNNVFEFSEVLASEVMVTRTSIAAVPIEANFQTLLNEIAKTGHSRYPVIGNSLDDIRGVLYFKELAEPLAKTQLALHTPIEPWIRAARFVPEFTALGELLALMQRSHLSIVILVDEFGGTVGLVTIDDLIARIIGYNPKIPKTDKLLVQTLDEQTFLVQAQINLEELNEILHLNLPLIDEYQTLGGFLLYQLQKIPALGETLHYDNLELTIVSAEGPRLHQIRIHRRGTSSNKSATKGVNGSGKAT